MTLDETWLGRQRWRSGAAGFGSRSMISSIREAIVASRFLAWKAEFYGEYGEPGERGAPEPETD